MRRFMIVVTILALSGLACNALTPATATPIPPTATNKPTLPPTAQVIEVTPEGTAATLTVQVFFTVADPLTMHLQPVDRQFPDPGMQAQKLSDTLHELLAGPTAAEKAQGLTSWFGPNTADALSGVMVVMDSDVTIDFTGLSTKIPNASTSAGSVMLLSELNATLFQFPFVQKITYRLDGSCPAFWEWLQSACHAVTRADWQVEPTP
jgi:hypothetical protein